MTSISPKIILTAETVVTRLERIKADSPWAHQASGVRASLSKLLKSKELDYGSLEDLLSLGFDILEKAASEIPDSNQ
jgi:hypothetical protein